MSLNGRQRPDIAIAAEDTGILANDPMGLRIGSEGYVTEETNSGVFTNIMRLASQLQTDESVPNVSPIITIETDESTYLIKEYDGNTVALKVPSSWIHSSTANDSTTTIPDASPTAI